MHSARLFFALINRTEEEHNLKKMPSGLTSLGQQITLLQAVSGRLKKELDGGDMNLRLRERLLKQQHTVSI